MLKDQSSEKDIVFLQRVDRKYAREIVSIPYVEMRENNSVGEVVEKKLKLEIVHCIKKARSTKRRLLLPIVIFVVAISS